MDGRTAVDCWYFLQGTCAKGDSCAFRHDEEKKSQAKKDICVYFQQGYCFRGSSCMFLHSSPDETSEAGAVNTATGPSTADGLDPVAEQNRMRQEIRERMSKPLSARPGRIAPSTDTNKRDSMSPIVTKPPPPPPRKRPEATVAVKAAAQEPAKPKEAESKRFGRAAKERAIAAGALATAQDRLGLDHSPQAKSQKRPKSPIKWGKSASKPEPESESVMHIAAAKKAKVAPSTTEKIEPYGSKLLPKRTPITFQPQPIDKPKTAAPPVHVAPKTQPKLNQSQGDGNHSGIPSIKPSSTPKGSTPKAGTPKAALTRCPSEVENDDGEEVLEDLDDLDEEFRLETAPGADVKENAATEDNNDDDDLDDLEAEFD